MPAKQPVPPPPEAPPARGHLLDRLVACNFVAALRTTPPLARRHILELLAQAVDDATPLSERDRLVDTIAAALAPAPPVPLRPVSPLPPPARR